MTNNSFYVKIDEEENSTKVISKFKHFKRIIFCWKYYYSPSIKKYHNSDEIRCHGPVVKAKDSQPKGRGFNPDSIQDGAKNVVNIM